MAAIKKVFIRGVVKKENLSSFSIVFERGARGKNSIYQFSKCKIVNLLWEKNGEKNVRKQILFVHVESVWLYATIELIVLG